MNRSKTSLLDDELADYFRRYVQWQTAAFQRRAEEAFHDSRIEAVAEFHVMPLLPRARMANLGGNPAAAEGFAAALQRYLRAEPINRDRHYASRQALELHPPTHRQIVVNTIALRMIDPFRQRRPFAYRSNQAACLYLAQLAVDDVEREIESLWMAHGKPPVESLEALAESAEAGRHVLSVDSGPEGEIPSFPDPFLSECDPSWLALYALRRHLGYNDRQIHLALQRQAPDPEAWQAAEPRLQPPAFPGDVWNEVRQVYGLPDWETVRSWFFPCPSRTPCANASSAAPGRGTRAECRESDGSMESEGSVTWPCQTLTHPMVLLCLLGHGPCVGVSVPPGCSADGRGRAVSMAISVTVPATRSASGGRRWRTRVQTADFLARMK